MAEYRNPPTPDTPRNRGDYDAPHISQVTPEEDIRTIMINRVSWGAVFSGVAMALVVQFIMNLLGVGVGLATLEEYGMTATAAGTADATGPTLGVMAWWAISGIIAAGVGGFTAGRLAGEVRETTAAWHGLASWSVSVILVVGMVVAGAGVLVGGTLSASGISASMTPYGVSVTAPGTMAGTNGTTIGTTGTMTGETVTTPGAVTPPQLGTTRATLTNEQLATGALVTAVSLLLGALFAWFGGWLGAVEPTITEIRGDRRLMH